MPTDWILSILSSYTNVVLEELDTSGMELKYYYILLSSGLLLLVSERLSWVITVLVPYLATMPFVMHYLTNSTFTLQKYM